ncbi:hypothetical protein ACH5RR_000467 [Cinchona calisaya]|uniref:Casein kinase II subunit beta n=1 Tax=Cinchona calisaya TaxID=153742 RepID=A0ABD3B0Z3_9GENT
MYRDRGRGGGGSSKSEIIGGPSSSLSLSLDRKRINDALDKQLEKSSPSTSRGLKDGKSSAVAAALPSTSAGIGGGAGKSYPQLDQRDTRSSSTLATNKIKASDDESETDSEESDVSGSDGDDTSWISWFCNLRGNEFFCDVDDEYIQDDFNLCGLSSQVPYYDYALDLILDVESSHGDMFSEEQNELVESAAEMLYGLIHVRYILTSKGIAAMLEKYKNYDFGRCPRVYCCGQPCLPVGQSDIPRSSTVKIYCPKCEDIYYPRSKYQGNIDGAYFGTTFPHLFLMTYGHLKPQKPSQSYVPRVFGFKVHKT